MNRPLLTGRNVIPITRETFPIGIPVTVESFIDTRCGWEFDAPLHFMIPFHRYCIVSSCGTETIDAEIEDMLVDMDCYRTLKPDTDPWPYSPEHLKRLFYRVRTTYGRDGKLSKRYHYYRSTVTVKSWSKWPDNDHGFDFTCQTEKQC